MQAQQQRMKGDLIIELKGRTTTTTIKEITPQGVRIESNEVGETKGKYNAQHMETVSVFLKPDGSSDWEAKAIESTREGDFIVITGRGKGTSTSSGTVSWDGEVQFMTKSTRLSWLDGTKGIAEGTGTPGGEWQGKVYSKK